MGKKKRSKKKSKKTGSSSTRSGAAGASHCQKLTTAAEDDIEKRCEKRIAEINALEKKMASKQKLRFAIGDRVECKMHVQSDKDILDMDLDSLSFPQMMMQLALGEGAFEMTYKPGTVVQLWDLGKNGDVYPYQVRLDEDNQLICPKVDEDVAIRKSNAPLPTVSNLFKQPPAREDCPICFLPLPLQMSQQTKYFSCCGKVICQGCIVSAHVAGVNRVCPFCRAPENISNAEFTRRTEERIKRGDPEAMVIACLQLCKNGNEEEKERGNELLRQAANLGLCTAQYRLGCAYVGSGPAFGVVEQDIDKGMFHFEAAAIAGHGGARYNLGVKHINDSSTRGVGVKHLMIGAKSGYKDSMDLIKQGFVEGWVTKNELEETLRANEESLDELKSVQREKAALMWEVFLQEKP